MSTYTVVCWDKGDHRVRPVGATTDERRSLGKTLRAARAKHLDAEIVEWSRRDLTVKAILAARKKAAESRFVDAVGGHAEAVEYEQTVLAIGREFLPSFARTVLDGGKSCAEYWEWLTESVEIAEREAAAAAIEREDNALSPVETH